MFSFKFIVRADKNNDLRLRLTCNRVSSQFSLGLKTTQEELELALSPRASNLRLAKLMAKWTSQIKEYMVELADTKSGDKDVKEISGELKKRLIGDPFPEEPESKPEPVCGNFVPNFQKFIESKTNEGTKGVYQHTLDRIRLHDPDIDSKSFEDINLKWLTDFEAFCAKTASKNARNVHLRNIRAVFNNAIDFEITTAYPFRRFKIRPEATRKRSMSVEELRKLFGYPTEEYAEIYRDMFRLIFMLIGINTIDLWRLKTITKDGRIEYKRAKTGRAYSIKVEPEAMEIINKYRGKNGLLCIADRWSDSRNFRHQCNKALQSIGAERNKGGRVKGGAPKKTDKENKPQGLWPELTTYWARHSWATIARSLGVSIDDIALALGHGDGHDLTRIYLDEDRQKIDDANRKVLDWVLYGKKTPWKN